MIKLIQSNPVKLNHLKLEYHRFKAIKLNPLSKFTISASLLTLLLIDPMPAEASRFIDDASVTGNLFSWSRDRERQTVDNGGVDTAAGSLTGYRPNLRHSTFSGNIDMKSGYFADFFALELGIYGAWEAINRGDYHPNEVAFSSADTLWDEKYKGDVSDGSFYKAQVDLNFGNFAWLKAGYIQPSGNTLLKTHKTLLLGTYRGAELGTTIDFNHYGALSASYMWADQYKTPWYKSLYGFKYGPKGNRHTILYLHSAGLKYDLKNNVVLESAFGQAHHYMDQYFAKASYKKMVFSHPLLMNYQFYGAQDQDHLGDKAYDGFAWMQVVSFKYLVGPLTLQTDGKLIQADGKQGYFLKRMTPDRDSSDGRLDAWWDSRSNFNANGERVIFAKISYDLGDLSQSLSGFTTGVSAVYAWNGKPSSDPKYDQDKRITEFAWNLDLGYTAQKGWAKNSSIKIHYTNYKNNSNYATTKGGFDNLYQDEQDVKLIVTIPFTMFSPIEK